MTISADQIARVRAFNRDYTRRIGVLADGLLDSPYSLTEVRVMYEIAHRAGITAAELADDLDLDRGYLSRLLKGFEKKKLLARVASPGDARRRQLKLTSAGKRVFAPLDRRSREQVREMLTALDGDRLRAVLQAMQTIQDAFGGQRAGTPDEGDSSSGAPGSVRPEEDRPENDGPEVGRAKDAKPGTTAAVHAAAGNNRRTDSDARAELVLRGHRAGDLGWVVQRHGEIYHQEYGWNEEFEGLVAGIVAEFVRELDAARERCWIAEREGRRVGCIFLVAKDTATAKLRLLLVEPEARGLGVGRALVNECVRFAREVGYRKVVLWTQQNLTAARKIYRDEGFKRVAEEPHHSFGYDLVGETWELELCAAADAKSTSPAGPKVATRGTDQAS